MYAVVVYLCMLLFVILMLVQSDFFCVCVYVSWSLQSTEPGGHFICTVYLEEKKETAEQHVKVTW